MIKLYFHHTPNPRKVALLLEELGLEYETVGIDMYRGEQHGDAYRAINPNGKVPAIVDGAVTMFDSSAVLLYLADREGRFAGDPNGRPALLSWLMFTASGLGPFSGQAFHFNNVHTDSPYATNRYRREVERHYSVMERRLSASPYLAGNEYTITDMAAWPWLGLADAVVGAENALSRWPAVKAWYDGIASRDATRRATEAGKHLEMKSEFDEETLRALFPQNYAAAL